MQRIILNVPFCYASPSQAAWLTKLFRQSGMTAEAYLADASITAADPNPELFLLQLQQIGLLTTDGTDLRPTSETCACYPLLNGLYIAGNDVDGYISYLRDIYNERYLSLLKKLDEDIQPMFLIRL